MTDYTVFALEESLSMTRSLGIELMGQLENEHRYVMECYETGILLEADTGENKEKISLWERIKNFFKKIFSIFRSKSKNITISNQEFLDKNKEKLLSNDCNGLTLEVVNYKSQDFLVDKVNGALREMRPIIQNHEKPVEELRETFETIKKKYVDEEGSLANGLKMLLRTGNPKGKLSYTTYEESQIKPKITEYIEFCEGYNNSVAAFEKCRTNAENAIKDAELALKQKKNKDKVNESTFLLIENCYNTDLVGLEVVSEDTNGNSSAGNDEEVKPTGGSVTTSDPEQKNNSDDTEKSTKSVAAYKSLYNDVNNFLQVLITSALTITEEKCHVFITKLKQILNPELTEEAKKEEENKEDNKGKTKKKKGGIHYEKTVQKSKLFGGKTKTRKFSIGG